MTAKRRLLAVEALENCHTAESRQLLQQLAKGLKEGSQTKAAVEALGRLEKAGAGSKK